MGSNSLFDRLEGAHQDAEGQREGGREQERDADPLRGHEDGVRQVVLQEQLERAPHHLAWRGQEVGRRKAAVRRDAPGPEHDGRHDEPQEEARHARQGRPEREQGRRTPGHRRYCAARTTLMSVRRFSCRPASVVLGATGFSSPRPIVWNRAGWMFGKFFST